jgi:hypothetical protein
VTVVSVGGGEVTPLRLDIDGTDFIIESTEVVDAWEPTGPGAA